MLTSLRHLSDPRAWRTPTIARDLTVGLVLTISLVFSFAGTVNYFYSTDRDSAALYEKANEIMENLASVLVTPMWNLNTEELEKIVGVYRQSGIVLDIRLVDDAGDAIIKARGRPSSAFLEMTRVIHHEKMPIGRVTVYFSDSDITAKQREIAVYSAVVFAFLTLALVAATTILLRRYLSEPFLKIQTGLDVISAGDYTHTFERARQTDVNAITEKIMGMASEIARREAAIEENRAKLEILNQAILDIFSSSDTDGLVRTTMMLAHKVCGVTKAWFAPGPIDGEDSVAATPMVCVEGELHEGTEIEIRPFVEQPASDRIFRFAIKSRHRTVGEMTLGFEAVPDPSTTSLLKSLMSLATLAMIRQSFIRETAFIEAELQVAEAVQRSMLPDDSKLPANANVAYHYEPVLRVGGDWFSMIQSRDGQSLYVILGDVTGHGLAQGLVTTATAGAIQVVQSMIHEFEGVGVSMPSQILTQLDNVITRIAGRSNLRMTCVCARLDFREMTISVCNAGHTFPLVVRQRQGEKPRLESLARKQQLMLGEFGDDDRKAYTDAVYPLEADDLLVFYTDGLTEAVDAEGRAFVRKFHRHFGKFTAARSANQVKEDLIGLFRQHVDGVPVKDDICVLVVGKREARDVRAA